MDIKQVQRLLLALGHSPGAIDGIWGAASQAALDAALAEYGGDTTPATGTFWDDIEFFERREFRCTCPRCGGFPVEPEETMVRVVDEIRRRAGVPISIVDSGGSGIRCKQHNAEVGGVTNSEHLYGRAADLHSSLSPYVLKKIAEEVTADMIPGRGGIGLYAWGVHVDVGKYSRWSG